MDPWSLVGPLVGLAGSWFGNRAQSQAAAAAPGQSHKATYDWAPLHSSQARTAGFRDWFGEPGNPGAVGVNTAISKRISDLGYGDFTRRTNFGNQARLDAERGLSPILSARAGATAGAGLDAAMARGATLQEALGVGNPGGGSGGSTVIGNGPQIAQERQKAQVLSAQQAQLDKTAAKDLAIAKLQSDTQRYVADTQAGVQREKVDVDRSAVRVAQTLAALKSERDRAEIDALYRRLKLEEEKGARDAVTQTLPAILLRTMTPDNLEAHAFYQAGLRAGMFDKGRIPTPRAVSSFLNRIRGQRSKLRGEQLGAVSTIRDIKSWLDDVFSQLDSASKRP